MGRFLGLKLHLICNERGELLNFMITPGDVDDIELTLNSFYALYSYNNAKFLLSE